MIQEIKTFDEWQKLALSDGCSIHLCNGTGSKVIYHAHRDREGSVGIWNMTDGKGYLDAKERVTA